MKFIDKPAKNKLITATCWLACYFTLFIYQISCSYSSYTSTHLVVAFIDLVCIAACSYIIKKYLIPRLLYKKKLVLFIAVMLLQIAVIANIMQWLAWVWYDISGSITAEEMKLVKVPFYQIFTAYLVIFFGSVIIIAIQLLVDQWLAQTRYAVLQKEKAQTELNFLKAQINPHFLFNSINSIFAHIDKNNTIAREIVLKFSDMLRYQLYECQVEIISFEKEFAYLNNYIELQRLRKEENLVVKVEVDGKMKDFEIAPLLIIPFIENAFKYASNHDSEENIVKIILTKKSGFFNFYCVNTKDRMLGRTIGEKGGIGINNVQRRLELIYPGKHKLNITNTEFNFEVNLTIEIA